MKFKKGDYIKAIYKYYKSFEVYFVVLEYNTRINKFPYCKVIYADENSVWDVGEKGHFNLDSSVIDITFIKNKDEVMVELL